MEIWENQWKRSKYSTIRKYASGEIITCCWLICLLSFCCDPTSIMIFSSIFPILFNSWTTNECDMLLERLQSFDVADHATLVVLYITVMWVSLTFVSKLLVLNRMCNGVVQPTFYVCREKTKQCHTPCRWLYGCGVVDYIAWVIYSRHVGLFHSSVKIHCLWKPKHIWYAEDVFS